MDGIQIIADEQQKDFVFDIRAALMHIAIIV